MVAMTKKPKVLYIIGEGRSGSTLLEMVLGQHQQLGSCLSSGSGGWLMISSVGVVRLFLIAYIGSLSLSHFFNESAMDLDQIINARNLDNMSAMAKLWVYQSFEMKRLSVDILLAAYERLYAGIIEASGASFVIDASKSIPFAYIMSQCANIDFYFLHLVRELCDVTYSRQKKKIRKEIVGHKEFMPTVSTVKSAVKWLSNNYLAPKVVGNHPYHINQI